MNLFKNTTSLPELFFTVSKQPHFKGFFHRENEDWVHYDPKSLTDNIYYLSLALREIGVKSGVGVGIIAPSSPKWFMLDIATQIAGGYIVPLFSNISSEHFEFQVKDSKVKILAIDCQETLSPQIRELIYSLESVIHFLPQTDYTEHVKHNNSFFWDDFLEKGKLLNSGSEKEQFEHRVKNVNPDEIFSVIYTSGSTGTPKGVPLTQKNMMVHLRAISDIFPMSAENNICMSILPVAHVFERMAIYYFSGVGLPVYFADSPNNIGKYLPEIRPTVLTVVPRILEKLYEKLVSSANQRKGLVKLLIKYAIKKARNLDPNKVNLRGTILDKLVYSKMRAALGDNFNLIMSGSSALNISVNRFLRNIGLPILEGYGMTECSPVISAENNIHNKIGSVGKPVSCLDVRISSEDEIEVKGDSVFSGYLNRPELNKEIFTEDGYFKTGDKGIIDEEGYIWITGRLKEMFKTSTGKYVRPIPIEQALSQLTSVEAAQVFAEGRKFTSAILFLSEEIVRVRLKKSVVDFKPEKALKSRRLNTALQKHIDSINKKLNEWEKIKKWKAVFVKLSTENGLLTPTLKLRRNVVEKVFEKEINEMYE